VVQIVDLGLQKQRPYKGKEKDPAYEIMLTYELLDEFMVDEDGNEDESRPRFISERMPIYRLEAEKARSTQRYYALDPKEKYDGDFSKLVNTPCMVTVTQTTGKDGNVYANVGGVSAMRDKEAKRAKPLVNTPVVLSIGEADTASFEKLPEWVQDLIKGGLAFEGSPLWEALNKEVDESDEPVEDDDSIEDNDPDDEDYDEDEDDDEENW